MITNQEILTILQKLDFVQNKNVDTSKDFRDQGFDSLDTIQILFHVQEHFNIEIDEESIANREWSSVQKITDKLNVVLK